MIEPFVPLYPWLRDALDDAQLVLAIAEPDEDDPRPALDARDVGDHLLDLRHGPTRYAVLRALADAGHARPWALGAPWSPMTDEQAGRATAAILCAVGEDPAHPVAAVPVGVFGPWALHPEGSCWDRKHIIPQAKKSRQYWYLRAYVARYGPNGSHGNWYVSMDSYGPSGPETGDAGRLAADNAARNLGCLFIEELTPT